MYLFDKERTGRIPFDTGSSREKPELVWELELPHFPIKGPESSCVIDQDNNIYFGCHDNCIYSLNEKGEIRWQFMTEQKVYSSPILFKNKLFFCCNKSDVICLNLAGKLIWSFKGMTFNNSNQINKILDHIYSAYIYDYYFTVFDKIKNINKINSWCSPNLLSENIIIANLYGIGIVALDINTGHLEWKVNLGTPYNHLAGVAITGNKNNERIAAVSQSNGLYWINNLGEVIWRRNLVRRANSWGNPTIDNQSKHIYCSTSKYNSQSWIFKFDYEGSLVWKTELKCGIRAAISISSKEYVVVPGLNGCLYIIDKRTGNINNKFKIADQNKGLWTSAALDTQGRIIINAKYNTNKGALIKINEEGKIIWEYTYGKALSVPIVDANNNIYAGTWDGKFVKLKSN